MLTLTYWIRAGWKEEGAGSNQDDREADWDQTLERGKNSPRLGAENRLGSANPHVAPQQGALWQVALQQRPSLVWALKPALWNVALHPGGLWIKVVSTDPLEGISQWHYSYMTASLLLHTHSPCLSFQPLICLFLKTVFNRTPSWARKDSTDSAISPSSA